MGTRAEYRFDEESQESDKFDFTSTSIRHGFIKKVYSILMLQLSITLAMIVLILLHEPTKSFVHEYLKEIAYPCLLLSLVVVFIISCFKSARHRFPINYILLLTFTLLESVLVAIICSVYRVNEVMMAVGITAVVCLALTVFAFQTKWDFTMYRGFMLIVLVVLIIFGIVVSFVRSWWLEMLYASCGALIFSFYLVIDTQLIMGGQHKYAISPEDYILAVLCLYLDIINLFLYILKIMGQLRRE